MELDTLYIKSIKTDGEHNYIAELNPKDSDPQDRTSPAPEMKWDLEKAIDRFLDSSVGKGISIVLLALILGIVVYKICQNFTLFEVSGNKGAQGMADDTIYGHTWDKELKALMAKGEYGEAVVLCYLHLLEMLDKRKAIVFMESKTPQMFLDEMSAYYPPAADATVKDTFHSALQTLTNHYLRIRYGHVTATEELAKAMIEQDAKLASLSNHRQDFEKD